MALLVPLAVALMVFAVIMAIYLVRSGRRMRREQLRTRLGGRAAEGALLLRHENEGAGSRLRRLLAESGLGLRPALVLQWMAILTVAGALGGAVLGGGPAATLCALVGLGALPVRILLTRHRRLRRCDEQLPQALQLMVLALRAGHALPGALALAARETAAPLGDELRQAVDEQQLGSAIGVAIERLANRLRSCDSAQTFAVAILVLEQTGGNLIAVIERIIETARARTQYMARLRALTATGRWSATILGVIPLVFFLLAGILDPTYWPMLLTDPTGQKLLAAVLLLWACGGTLTWRLIARGQAA
jgi:tight adherence protein B